MSPPEKKQSTSHPLGEVRKALDEVDRRLLEALSERHRLILDVARIKGAVEHRIRDPLREEEVLTRLVENGRAAGLDGWFVTRLFREILDQSLRVQHEHLANIWNPERRTDRTLVVGYQGGEGAYSHITAMRHFGARGGDIVYHGYDTFQKLLEAVRDGTADYAVLPIENTTAGSINESYDLLARMSLSLVGEEITRVEHCLVAPEHIPLSQIRKVFSHPQALAQCSEFLSTLHDCKVEAFTDTALAVAKVKDEKDFSQAAIASEQAAQLHGLPILKRDIANQKENYTRMVIVAREPAHYDPRIPCKTSLIFATRHEEGALARCVNLFAEHRLNLTKLESRPRPNTPWEYLFYVDFEGNVDDERVQEALEELASRTSYLKVLGSYPARTTKDARPVAPRTKRSSPREAPTGANEGSNRPLSARRLEELEKKPYRLASRANRAEDTRIAVQGVVIGDEQPVFVLGPEVIESREQIRACAQKVKDGGGHLLYGGCVTREGNTSFRGLGFEALEWLEEAGRDLGLPIVTEVLHPGDLGKIARKADVLLIGADNMQNLALLEEAGRTDRTVILERGIMASVDEWLEAAESILARGNQQVILCERGIRTFETATRNTLDLSAIPVVRERSHLPILVDPSRATGVRRWIDPMARAALAAGAHGLIIAVHEGPENASLGAGRSLPFEEVEALMHASSPRID